MNSRKGFTLVEVLVVGLLMAILGGGILAFFSFSAQQAREGSSSSLLQMYAESVADQIARTSRAGTAVLDQTAGEVFVNRENYLDEHTTNQVLIYDAEGTVTGGYFLNDAGILKEFDTGIGDWIDYTAGAEVVRFAAGSSFTVFRYRNALALDVRLIRTANGITDTLMLREARYACRN